MTTRSGKRYLISHKCHTCDIGYYSHKNFDYKCSGCWEYCQKNDIMTSKEFGDKVLEGGRKTLANFGPVHFEITFENLAVEMVFLYGLVEWVNSLDHNKKNDTNGEDVDLFALIYLTQFNLGSHIGLSTAIGFELVDALVSGEAKISKFNSEIP